MPNERWEAGGRSHAWILVAIVLPALGLYLVSSYSLIAFSDPAHWYGFGRSFAESFGRVPLAYGFPLLVAAAAHLVGPYAAFLVNVPVLLVLALLVHELGAALYPSGHAVRSAPADLAGGISLLLLVTVDAHALRVLVNPYRDPLAFCLTAAACLTLMRLRRRRGRPLGLAAASGALLALACSTRETSVLMLLPFLVYAAASRAAQRDLPVVRAGAAFALGFALAGIPFLIQNQLLSGNPLLPAQAAGHVQRHGSLAPGLDVEHVASTLPGEFGFLAQHYGVVVLALFGVGLLAGLRRRSPEILALALPALLTYAVFYAYYYRVAARYLWVLDLFLFPVAAAGAAWLVEIGTSRVAASRRGAWRRRASAAALLAAAGFALYQAFPSRERFRLADARALVGAVSALVPPGALLLGDRPIGEILGCFADRDTRTLPLLVRSQTLRDPRLVDEVEALVAGRSEVYLIARSRAVRHSMQRGFDVTPLRTLAAGDYGLGRRIPSGRLLVDRAVPWSALETRLSPPVSGAGDRILELDAGQLSKLERGFARLEVGDELLTRHPGDGRTYHAVSVRPGEEALDVRLTSDAPVPRSFLARLLPIDAPLRLRFDGDHGIAHAHRFSPSFLRDPRLKYPGIRETGWIDVPTLRREGAAFVFVAGVVVGGFERGEERSLEVGIGRHALYRSTLVSPASGSRGTGSSHVLSFHASAPLVRAETTRLRWSALGPRNASEPAILVRSLTVHRRALVDAWRVEFGGDEDAAFEISGLQAVREEAPGLRGRRTQGVARLRVFAPGGGGAARLEVVYRLDAPAAGAPLPRPLLSLNGRSLRGRRRVEPGDGGWRVTERFRLAPAAFAVPVGVLEVHPATEQRHPTDAAVDAARSGLVLESLALEAGPAPRREGG